MIPLRDNVPTRTFPIVTVALIVLNAIVWFWELGVPGVALQHHGHLHQQACQPAGRHRVLAPPWQRDQPQQH